MITNVKKYLFIGVQEDLDLFFIRAQKKGVIEFLSTKSHRSVDYPEELQNMITALKVLSKQPTVKAAEMIKDLDAQKLISTVVESKETLEKQLEEERLIRAEITRIEPLGDFSLEEVRELERESHRHIQFFCVKEYKLKKEAPPEDLIYLNSEYDMKYFMSVSEKVLSFPGMVEMHFDRSLSELKTELNSVRASINQCEQELRENAAYIDFLEDHLKEALNEYNLASASGDVSTHLNDALFAVEGWIPKKRLHALFPLLEGLGIHAEEIAIEKGECVPTFMQNKGFGKMGEDLVHIYDTPATSDKDPSRWVFWAFAVFFAMIISDAGYGLIFLLLSLFLVKRYPHVQPSIKRFFRLFKVLAVSCIIWGVLSNAYFGIELSPKNSLNKLSIIHYLAVKKADYHIAEKDETYREVIEKFPQLADVTSGEELLAGASVVQGGFTRYTVLDDFRDSIFMELALLVGVLHISLSLLRNARRHFGGVGWIFAIVGGYLFFPKMLGSTSVIHFMYLIPQHTGFVVGEQLLWGGMGLAVLLAVIQHRWAGFIELTKPIELFADILSYLRIYALGLAAMILAKTFNEMGMNLGFVAGFFVILAGHLINIVVGIMGGTIHGLRLNFIEWYHHSFVGGGRLFHPLKLFKIRGE
ncbi:MAG: hypothetical protein K1060chlam2_01117 [Chlamydiae bacterium]|nr:hypothetical protein [Chlamydiota bacterium]